MRALIRSAATASASDKVPMEKEAIGGALPLAAVAAAMLPLGGASGADLRMTHVDSACSAAAHCGTDGFAQDASVRVKIGVPESFWDFDPFSDMRRLRRSLFDMSNAFDDVVPMVVRPRRSVSVKGKSFNMSDPRDRAEGSKVVKEFGLKPNDVNEVFSGKNEGPDSRVVAVCAKGDNCYANRVSYVHCKGMNLSTSAEKRSATPPKEEVECEEDAADSSSSATTP
eukprot:Polyplicarium_translucidae@DN1470_c0_g1_i1.p1